MGYKDYFDFSKGERIGIFILIGIIVLTVIAKEIIRSIEPEIDHSAYLKELAEFEKSIIPSERKYASFSDDEIAKRYDSLQLFKFDPNKVDSLQLISLGFYPKQIKQFLNYRNKGGKFYKPRDVAKLYSVNDLQFSYLQPYISIKNTRTSSNWTNSSKPELTPFEFNPNTVTLDELLKMNLNKKVATTLIKYRNSGAHFYKSEDVRKIYGISENIFADLKPFMKFDKKNDKIETALVAKIIEINSAAETDFAQLKGIGATLSSRIVKFRKLLGGFHSIQQINDVYGFNKEIFPEIKSKIKVDKSLISKININFASINDLKKHPYIDYKTAKKIVEYRSKNGSFNSVNILITNKVLQAEIFNKIKHYLVK